MSFQYRTVQLNRLDWRAYISHPNPVAIALLTRMRIAPREQVRVKAICLAHLVGLKLSPRRKQLLGAFLGIYLKLPPAKEIRVQQDIAQLYPQQKEAVMELLTEWEIKGMEQGLKQGLLQGLEQPLLEQGREEGQQAGREAGQQAGALAIVQRVLTKRFGTLDGALLIQLEQQPTVQLEALAEALLDFHSADDLTSWLVDHPTDFTSENS